MKIITWNCNGALRKKLYVLEEFDADIIIVQECEDPSQSTKDYNEWAGEYLWVGESKNKGIGVFAKKGNTVSKLNWSREFSISGLKSTCSSLKWRTEDLRLFLPFIINNEIKVLGVWTKGSEAEAFSYIGQFWKYMQIHGSEFEKGNQIILGDFNSNAQWDKPDRWWSHSSVVRELEQLGLKSLYHHKFNETQGNESQATFYMHRKTDKPYHIDYAFVTKEYINANIAIGNTEKWLSVSDHLPLLIEI